MSDGQYRSYTLEGVSRYPIRGVRAMMIVLAILKSLNHGCNFTLYCDNLVSNSFNNREKLNRNFRKKNCWHYDGLNFGVSMCGIPKCLMLINKYRVPENRTNPTLIICWINKSKKWFFVWNHGSRYHSYCEATYTCAPEKFVPKPHFRIYLE